MFDNWQGARDTCSSVLIEEPQTVPRKALKALAAKISAGGKWFEAYINGDGVTFTFRLLVKDDSVAAFLVEAEFEIG